MPRIERAVDDLRDGGERLDECSLADVAADLAEELISLGERQFLDEPWVRTFRMEEGNFSGVRQGIYPGQQWTHAYGQYRLEVVNGAKFVPIGANGGPFNDPDFLLYSDGWITVRASDDQHRDGLIADIEEHIRRANDLITTWNSAGLPAALKRIYEARGQDEAAKAQRESLLTQSGFVPARQRPTEPVPLPDTKSRSNDRIKRRTRRTDDGLRYSLTRDQLAEILECVDVHRDNVERYPGSGAAPEAVEDSHRDQLLGALNLRFRDGTAESFSRLGKTDIRLVVDDHSYLYFECKIWAGPSSVNEALDQLTGKYLTYRDGFGVLVFFVRDRANPAAIPQTAIDQMTIAHGATRVDDVAGFPVLATPIPGADGRTIEIALVMIVVDSSPPRG